MVGTEIPQRVINGVKDRCGKLDVIQTVDVKNPLQPLFDGRPRGWKSACRNVLHHGSGPIGETQRIA